MSSCWSEAIATIVIREAIEAIDVIGANGAEAIDIIGAEAIEAIGAMEQLELKLKQWSNCWSDAIVTIGIRKAILAIDTNGAEAIGVLGAEAIGVIDAEASVANGADAIAEVKQLI